MTPIEANFPIENINEIAERKIRGQVSTFDIKLVCLIHMRKA